MQTNQSSQDGVVSAISLLLVAQRKTRRWLAEELGRDQFWIGSRMNNRTMFKFSEVEQIAQVFGLSLDEFLAVPAAPSLRLDPLRRVRRHESA
ncbi:FAD/FMN-containing dehydrogenase [Leifsonia xyli subsp. cynodontis DSM 46306]|uniref:HTH cro/C1-type domain-containing protein n=1 Tax=Leifsonia xyli subsp. cynodontis DSM 46306 TaxID=1389489 RepID=U3P3W2_LEIXC|nr:FAD/FMN-containing dehydrogenase [Leifsonia xyli subsp. cynodontis DSM 46306]